MSSRREFLKIVGGGVIAASTPSMASAQAKYPAKIGHLESPLQPRHRGLEKVAALVKERTKGEVEFSLFPAAQLGNARQMAEGVQFGAIECTVTPVAFVAGFNPVVSVFDIPFLMPDDPEKFRQLRAGKFAQYVLDSFRPRGFVALTFWSDGRKHMTSNRPLRSPDDFSGQKFRVMDSRVLIDQFAGLGANAIVMQFGELYTGLQTGVVDGQENPLDTTATMKFHEVQKYMVLSSHGVLLDVVLFNPAWWNRLPDGHRKIITDAFVEIRPEVDKMKREAAAKALEQIKASGRVEIRELTDEERKAWSARMMPRAEAAYLQTAGAEGKKALELYREDIRHLGLDG
jgi:tripartite ATP-independent transporter DctP family solute receptor